MHGMKYPDTMDVRAKELMEEPSESDVRGLHELVDASLRFTTMLKKKGVSQATLMVGLEAILLARQPLPMCFAYPSPASWPLLAAFGMPLLLSFPNSRFPKPSFNPSPPPAAPSGGGSEQASLKEGQVPERRQSHPGYR